ncbi:MAG: membrane protein [Saprospiraceae bacterium]|nr:MAG: membrane protein [Saprospiraceae bacterium]
MVFGLAGTKLLGTYLAEDTKALQDSKVDYILLFGFVLITALTSMVSIFSPINVFVTGAFTLAGIFLTYLHLEDLKQITKKVRMGWQQLSWQLKLAIFTTFCLSMCAIIIEFGESDIWFYHSQAIKWIKEYAVVPGLGNVHGRFAFNSHFFISSALFSLWFSEDYVVFPLNSLFFFLFTTRLLLNINNALNEQKWTFFILNSILLVTFAFQVFPLTNGTSTDAISSMVLVYAILLFMERSFGDKNITELVLFWSLIFTACTFKLSAVFAGFLLLYNLPVIFRNKKVLLFLATGLFILLPFITRNVILSGYLVYPVPSLDVLSVDWKIPIDEVILEKELIEGWSKLPHGGADMAILDIPKILDVPFGEWFSEWWPSRSIKWKVIMIIDLFTILLMIVALFRRNYKLALLSFTIFFNLVFWFVKTPNPRFGFAFLFMGMALVLSYSLAPFLKYTPKPNAYLFVLLSLLMVSFTKLKNQVIYTDKLTSSQLLIPNYYQVKTPPETFKTKNFTLNTPPTAPPAKGIWCYNLPLPCTPFPKESLVMRGKDYQSGFRVEPDIINLNSLNNK